MLQSPSAPPDLLTQLADTVATARTLEELVRPLLELLEAITGLESTYLTSIDEAAGQQRVVYARNSGPMQIPEHLSVPWSDTLCKRALEENTPYAPDVGERWGSSEAARALGIQTYVSTPVRTEDGALYGTLCGASAAQVALTPNAGRMLQMFSRLIGQQIERERLLARLREANAALEASALQDVVTGLPNRRALMEALTRRLAQRERDRSGLLLAFIDLDGFKAINDQHGHDIGDRFLAAVGHALSASLRAGDIAARLGGDEFVVLARVEAEDVGDALPALRTRLEDCLRGCYQLDGVTLDYAGASVGVVAAHAGQSADALLADADAAMYAVKHQRRRLAGTARLAPAHAG